MKFQIYQPYNRNWRWRLLQGKEVIADSAKSYKSKRALVEAVTEMVKGLAESYDYNPFPWLKGNSIFFEELPMNGH